MLKVRTCFLDKIAIVFNANTEYVLKLDVDDAWFVDLICFVTVLKNSKSNIFEKIVVVIIQWRKLLDNPFLFYVA